MNSALDSVKPFFTARGWEPFPFQTEVWERYRAGESGLIHSATGTGKTLAAWMGALAEGLKENPLRGATKRKDTLPLRVLWITPLRALASDTLKSLYDPLAALELPWSLEMRTGDSSSSERQRQRDRLPTALVTTPESLSLLLSYDGERERFGDLRLVVIDEWHELLGTKRGVQVELALARLKEVCPALRIWGVSATLGNLDEAKDVLLGSTPGLIVHGLDRDIAEIEGLIPDQIERFPWAGHLGTRMLPQVIQEVEASRSCLLFTNTRSQAELWYQAILDARPDWDETVALHHGSLDREVREAAEVGLKTGTLRAVVCTSSLDLGVDLPTVDRVLQIGSPKGVARLLQRAGRSEHRPGLRSRITCVPTHAFELLDIAAVREAAHRGQIEAREPLRRPLDVLAQHLVTIASGSGFEETALRREVQTTFAYRELTDDEWRWTLDFVVRGGDSLRAYPDFQRVVRQEDGTYRVAREDLVRRHRLSIGTIASDASIAVQYLKGGKIGTVEESFVARMKSGDRFLFGGRMLEFIRIKDMTVWVRRARSSEGAVVRWSGGRMPLSGSLAHAVRDLMGRARQGELDTPETQALASLLEIQARWSTLPDEDELLIERVEDREGHHLFVFPVEGRLVHEGIASVFAYRLSRVRPITFSISANDYGFELLSSDPAPLDEAIEAGLFDETELVTDILNALNAGEMSKRQFREIARVAGLVFPGFPGSGKSAKQIQASSGLFYDVFSRFDPENKLLVQARTEVLERQLEEGRMISALRRMRGCRLVVTTPPKPTPLAFPLIVDRLRETVSSETLADRIARLTQSLEAEADRPSEPSA